MTHAQINAARLHNLNLTNPRFGDAATLLAHLGAIQAQDYGQARWALGSRLPGSTDASIENDRLQNRIARSWLFRGTLHMVAAEDLRWMTALTAPASLARMGTNFRKEGLDELTLDKITGLLCQKLAHGRVTRKEILDTLKENDIDIAGNRANHILYYATVKGMVYLSGPDGKQDTFALLDQRIPAAPAKTREEALAELALRYFTSHGPATVTDFQWWTGFTLKDSKQGLDAVRGKLTSFELDGQTYWLSPDTPAPEPLQAVHLLAGFDEYLLGYRERHINLDPAHRLKVYTDNGIFRPTLAVDGKITGTWARTVGKKDVTLNFSEFLPLPKARKKQFEAALNTYTAFMERPVKIA